jgi:hypothetical protein
MPQASRTPDRIVTPPFTDITRHSIPPLLIAPI